MKEKPGKPANDYARYSGIGFQMLFTILASVYAGTRLDKWLAMKFPAFTLVLTLGGVAMSMYIVIREFTRKKDQ